MDLHRPGAHQCGDLGGLYEFIGDYVKAEAFYKRALEACEHLLSPKHRDTLTAVGGLGWLYVFGDD